MYDRFHCPLLPRADVAPRLCPRLCPRLLWLIRSPHGSLRLLSGVNLSVVNIVMFIFVGASCSSVLFRCYLVQHTVSTDTKQCKRETDVVSFLGLWCYLPYRAVRVLLLCVAAVYCRLYRLMSLGCCLVGLEWPAFAVLAVLVPPGPRSLPGPGLAWQRLGC